MKIIVPIISLFFLIATNSDSKPPYYGRYALINSNELAYWVSNNGRMGINPNRNSGGLYSEDRVEVIYIDGIIWGGYVSDQIGNTDLRVGGSTYSAGTQPGWIENGQAVNPSNSRIYKIRKDWRLLKHEDLIQEAVDLFRVEKSLVTKEMTDIILNQYHHDWYEWPAENGAPYYDRDNNGEFDPEIDIAGLLDAEQVVWFVVNDLDVELTRALFGSPPIGLEVQYTLWAFKNSNKLGQFIYKRVKLINKSANHLQDFYIEQWSDPDIGHQGNDVVGCDSLLGIMYAYDPPIDHNAWVSPRQIPPVSVGYKILQGPQVPSFGDSALFNLGWKQNHKNLAASSFGYLRFCDYPHEFPILNGDDSYISRYNMLRGYRENRNLDNPYPFINSNTGISTKFPLHGDPVAGGGDIDGIAPNCRPGPRVMWLNSGPFAMAPGDTQEVVITVVGAQNSTSLQSLDNLKSNLQNAELHYRGYIDDFEPSSQASTYNPPYSFIFSRPYPNPFNPTVTLKYEIAEAGMVKINVYNILGQKVKVLFNEPAEVGLNIFRWDASDFAAGVYIIQINYNRYSLTHKVLLLK